MTAAYHPDSADREAHMTAEIDHLLTRYETGQISRGEFLSAVSVGPAAAPVALA